MSIRWEYAWTSAPCLDFVYQPSPDSGIGFPRQPRNYWYESRYVDSEHKLACFQNFVDRVLFYHGGSNIQKCALRCSTTYPCPSFYAWICAVLACNVKELYVSGSSVKGLELPSNLFTCKTLVVLKLSGEFLLNLPFHVSFPSLKTLSLKRVIYVDDFSMQRLFSSCPVLEDLEIDRNRLEDHWGGVLVTSISVPSLKRLTINSSYFHEISSYFHEIVRGYEYSIVINATGLESLILDATAREKISGNFSDSLHTASIKGCCASNILEQVARVKELTLCERAMENLNAASDFILPFFHNLTSLRLEINDTVGQNLLSNLLLRAPNLETLSLVLRFLNDDVSPWNPPESPPQCLLKLKRIEFHDFRGTTYDRSLVQYVFEHEIVLEKMTIYLREFDKEASFSPQMLSVRGDIVLYQKESSTCRVQFRGKQFDHGYPIDPFC